MNITRLNFLSSLPFVKSAISRSHFLSFDLEMSGIQTQQLTSPSIVDSIQKRYEKQKQSIDKFIPLQFGLCAFEVFPTQNKIVAYPFNFYIFPLTQSFETMRFSFHAGTMNFLTKNQFDFNKLFYEGIPYTNQQKLKSFQSQQNMNNLKQQLRRMRQVQSPEVKAFLKMNLPTIKEWIISDSQKIDVDIAYMKYHSYMLLKEKLQSEYDNIPLKFQFDNEQFHKRTRMTITKCTKQQKQSSIIPVENVSEESFLFNAIFDEIIKSRKPLIVHNGFYDMMHIYYRFIQDLPPSWNEYKKKIHAIFPYIYDNKYLFANSPTLNHQIAAKMTGLENCFVAMRQLDNKQAQTGKSGVKIEIGEECKQYKLDNLQCHEAGFDSLMTGYSFLKGVTHLKKDLNLLVNQQAFHTQNELVRNRIPLGSIKIPFNFEANDEDIYTKDSNPPVYFTSVMNSIVCQQTITEFFIKNYGSVNFYWTSRNMNEFCVSFISSEVYTKFLNNVKHQKQKACFYEIQGIQFMILTNQQQEKKMNNTIKIEKDISIQ